MTTESATSPVFLESRCSYRSFWTVSFALILGSIGAWLLYGTIRQIVVERPAFADLFPGIIVVAAWLLLAWLPTLYLAWRLLWKPMIDARIDGAGIWIDSRLYPWDTIRRIWGVRAGFRGSKVALRFQQRGLGVDKGIPMIPGLVEREYEELIESLKKHLDNHYPGVEIG